MNGLYCEFMLRRARLVLILLVAAGLFLPAAAARADAGTPCPSKTVARQCLPSDGPAALLRAIASLEIPCHGKAVEASRPEIARPGDAEPVAYGVFAAGRAGCLATEIDPPPRSA